MRNSATPWLLAAVLALAACSDSPIDPASGRPASGEIVLSESVFTRGGEVRARVEVAEGWELVPGSVRWRVGSGSAEISPIQGDADAASVRLTATGAVTLEATFTARGGAWQGTVGVGAPRASNGATASLSAERTVTVGAPSLVIPTTLSATYVAGAVIGPVRVEIRDSGGQVVSGATDSVFLALDPSGTTGSGALLGTLRARAVAGIATFSDLSIRVVGSQYRIAASSPGATGTPNVTTEIVAGPPSGAESTFALSDTVVAAGGTLTVTIQVRDQYGNPVTSVQPGDLELSASAGAMGSVTCVDGTCTATFTAPSTPQSVLAGALVAGASPAGSPQTVRVVTGTASAAQSVLSPDTATIAADGASTQVLTVRAADQLGNYLASGGAEVVITRSAGTGDVLSGGATGVTDLGGNQYAARDNGDGTYTVTVQAPAAPGTGSFTATLDGNAVNNGGSSAAVSLLTYADTTSPSITGPSGSAGDAASAKSIEENTAAVHTFTASESVTWSVDGGADAAKFSIDPSTGALTFDTAPDFETPTDLGDTAGNNTYVVVVKATDGSGNVSTQTVTVTVTDVDENPPTAPQITGPSGSAGDSVSAASVQEGTTPVFLFTADNTVAWSLSGGADQAQFTMSPGGQLAFGAAPDFEAPTDLGDTAGNNTYVVVVRATNTAGGLTADQTVTVTVTDLAYSLAGSAQASVAQGALTERIVFYVREGLVGVDLAQTTSFGLSSTGGGTFYSDYNGATPVTSMTITADVDAQPDSFVVFYQQATGAGTTATLTATRTSGEVVDPGSVDIDIVATAPASARFAGLACTATTGNSVSTSLAATGGCAVNAGELLVMVFGQDADNSSILVPYTSPAGWTLLREDSAGVSGTANQMRTRVYYQIAAATGDVTPTFSTVDGTSRTRSTYAIARFANPAAAEPFIGNTGLTTSAAPGSTITIPSQVADFDSTALLAFAVQNIGGNSYVPPAGLSTAAIAGNGGQAITMILFTADRLYQGPTQSYSVGTSQTANAAIGANILINPGS